MTSVLIVKELREHWLPLGALAALSGLGFLLITGTIVLRGESGSVFEALRVFLMSFAVIVALVLCNRLVVREYQAKTQLFLESLPLTRVRMISVKFGLGLFMLGGLVIVAFGLLCLVADRREVLSTRFLQIIASRAFAYTLCLYSFCFVMGLLGRYRIAIYLIIGIGLMALESMTEMELSHFGPFALINQTFSYERDEFPTKALVVTLGMAGVFSALAFVLPLVREGSAAALLSEKMSHREKLFITALILGFVFSVSMYDEKKEKKPFDLSAAIVAESEDVTVKMSIGASEDTAAGERLTRRVQAEAAAIQEYLGLVNVPPVFITTRRDLDANRYEKGEITESEGLLVRVNFAAAGWDEDRFMTWLVRELIIAATNGRAKLERKMWVLDGFAPFWVYRETTESAVSDHRQLALRALVGTSDGLSTEDLNHWWQFRERVGDGIAEGVAWSGLKTLARRQGHQRCREFLRGVLGADVPIDVRALFHERRNSLELLLRREAGLSLADFLADWHDELSNARNLLGDELARVPRLTATISFPAISPSTRQVRFRVAIDPPPETAQVTFRYLELSAFDHEVAVEDLLHEDLDYRATNEGELPETWARGSRIYSAFALEVPELGCEVISGWTRREVD